MSRRRNFSQGRCPHCKLGNPFCYCDKLEKAEGKIHVTLLMHFREKFLTTNTANLVHLSLKKSNIVERGLKDDTVHILKEGHTPIYLFPHEEAQELTPENLAKLDTTKPLQLIVPDGSWRQAKKMKRREEEIKDIPCFKLTHASSRYEFRRQTKQTNLCTAEAVAYALEALSDFEAVEILMENFKTMEEAIKASRPPLG